MNTLMDFIPILAWFASFAGLCTLVGRLFRQRAEFTPILTAALVITLLTAGGLLGILLPVAAAMYLLGFPSLALFAYQALKSRRRPDSHVLFAAAFLAAWAVYCMLRLRSYLPFENDDLSHWALVARHLLSADAFPDADLTILMFQAYPPGAAVFIYYFARFSASGEWMYAFAQAMLRAFCMLPLLGYVRKNRVFGYVTFVLAYLFLCLTTGFITSLRVDSLIAMLATGATATIYENRKNPARALMCMLPMSISLALIKNSGLFYCVLLAVLIMFIARRASAGRRALPLGLAAIGVPVSAFLAWILHVSLTFPEGLESKHAFSAASYYEEMCRKGLDVIGQTIKACLNAIIHPQNADMAIYALLFIALSGTILLSILFRKKALLTSLFKACAYLTAVYIAWLICVIGMYIFSMPESEAVRAASFARYLRGGTNYLAGTALLFVLIHFCHDKIAFTRGRGAILCLYFCFLALLTIVFVKGDDRFLSLVDSSYDRTTRRATLQEAIENHGIEKEKRYLVFCAPTDGSIENTPRSLCYLLKYEFKTTDIRLIYRAAPESGAMYSYRLNEGGKAVGDPGEWLSENLSDFDYLLLYTRDEAFEALAAPYAESAGVPIVHGETVPIVY